MITLEANLKGFRKQMRDILAVTKKEEVAFLNKRSVQVLIGSKGYPGAVQLTKKTTKGRLRSDLNKKYHVAGRVRGNKSGTSVKLLYILASKELKRRGIGKGMSFAAWRGAVAAMAERIWKKRDQSRAYLSAGWLAAVRDLGHTRRSDNNRSLRPMGTAGKKIGWAVAATKSNMRFAAYNNASSNGKTDALITAALNRAVTGQRQDMVTHLFNSIEKAARRHADV